MKELILSLSLPIYTPQPRQTGHLGFGLHLQQSPSQVDWIIITSQTISKVNLSTAILNMD